MPKLRLHLSLATLRIAAMSVATVALASACAQPLDGSPETTGSASTSLACSSTGVGCSREVELIAAGQWQSNYSAPSGIRYGWFWDANLWIDIAVKNIAFDKVVGVRWTTDGWRTVHDTRATYEKSLSGSYEQWGVDLTPAAKIQSCFWCNPASPKLEYAIYATQGGKTDWDSNGGQNHAVTLRNVYGEEPKLVTAGGVRCAGGAVAVDPVTGADDGSDYVATITDPQAIEYFVQKSTESHVELQEVYGQAERRPVTVTNSIPYNMTITGAGTARTMTIRGLRAASTGGYEAGQFLANLYLSGSSSLKLSVTNALMTGSHSMLQWPMGEVTFSGCTAK